MSEPFLGGIRIFGCNFAPRGWASLSGQILPVNQNQSLFSLIGTTYGGDGRTSFALPDARGRAVIGPDNTHTLGSKGGLESVALSANQMPSHTHTVSVPVSDSVINPPSASTSGFLQDYSPLGGGIYESGGTSTSNKLAGTFMRPQGNGLPHENRQPFITMNFCIALQGLFPSRN